MILFFLATLFLLIGHFLRVIRWEMFVEIYEKPSRQTLLRALSWGYFVNQLVPFRVGEILRVILASKRSLNGFVLMFATVIVERVLDVAVIAGLSLAFFISTRQTLASTESLALQNISIVYAFALLSFGVGALLFYRDSRLPKLLIYATGNLFNTKIRKSFFATAWGIISCFKDLVARLRPTRLFVSTTLMWACYLVSYGLASKSFQGFDSSFTFFDLWNMLFSPLSFSQSLIGLVVKQGVSRQLLLFLMAYSAVPLFFIFLFSRAASRQVIKPVFLLLERFTASGVPVNFMKMIPFANEAEELRFLYTYFKGDDRDYCRAYIAVNRGSSILRDFSGGSHATTSLVKQGGSFYFRKSAFSESKDKLKKQFAWMREKRQLRLPELHNMRDERHWFSYDMDYDPRAMKFSDAVHCIGVDKSWEILETLLTDLDEKLHSVARRPADPELVRQYIQEKFLKNIETVLRARAFEHLNLFDSLVINGKQVQPLKNLRHVFSPEFLFSVFVEDDCSDLHGDLTFENIIFSYGVNQPYYLIDPNHLNIHNSSLLDYAKLLQSMHMGYEFGVSDATGYIDGNSISIPILRSDIYKELYLRYQDFLNSKFSKKQLKSIYLHELIHYLRLLPYKLDRAPGQALAHYAKLLLLANEIDGSRDQKTAEAKH